MVKLKQSLLLLILLTGFSLNVLAQGKLVTVNFRNTEASKALGQVEKLSGMKIQFNYKDVDFTVTYTARNAEALTVVHDIIGSHGLSATADGKFIRITRKSALKTSGRTRKISGYVRDSDGEPLVGVPVSIGDGNVLAVTDVNGSYNVTIPVEQTVLKYSYVGMETAYVTIPQGSNDMTRDMRMVSSTNLNDVVVVGYGSLYRKDLTGSVATVNPDELVNTPAVTIDDALAGKAAGVQVTKADGSPGGAVRIRIRGGSSLTGGVDPLYIIDGIPTEITNQYMQTTDINNPIEAANYGDDASSSISGSFARGLNSLAGLNINDIESITIMKDASATAIYGSKAANGVVIITTKKGIRNNKPRFDFSYSITGSNPIKEKILNGDQYISALKSAIETSNYNMDLNKEALSDYIYSYYTSMNNSTLASLMAMGNANTDWLGEVLRTGLTHNIDFSVSGGSDKSRYYSSVSYTNQEGTLIATDFERYTGRVRLDNDITNKFRTAINISLSHTKNNITNGLYGQALGAPPILPIYNEDGTFANYNKLTNNAEINMGYWFNNFQNPLALASCLNRGKTFAFNGSVSGEYDIVKDLSFKTVLSAKYSNYNQYNYIPSYVAVSGSNDSGVGSRAQTTNIATYWENTLTYNHVFNDFHRINTVVGSSWEHAKSEFFSASGAGYPNDQFLNGLSSAQTPTSISGATPSTSSALLSFYLRANYVILDRYLFTLTGRSDTSSKFSKAHRTGLFPSGAFAWRISEEPILKDQTWIDEIKLRASMGKTGTQNISDYMFLTLYDPGAYRGMSALYPSQLGNDDIRWESTTQKDVGLDFSFLKNRIGGTLAYYHKVTDGALLSVTPAPSSGFNSVISNIAKIRNTGVEFELYGDFIRTKDFKWKGVLNVSHNGSKVLNILDSDLIGSDNKTINMGTTIIREGEPLGLIYGTKSNGIITTQEQLDAYKEKFTLWSGMVPDLGIGSIEYQTDDDGYAINDIIGNCTPDFYGGYTNTFTYKNWSLMASFVFSYGNDLLYQKDTSDMTFSTLSNRSVSVLDASSYNNLTSRPLSSYMSTYYMSDMNVYDASYLKLQTLSLSYNLPQSVLRKLSVVNAQAYITASNLFTITSYPGPDPSVSDNPYSVGGGGRDISSYPTTKSFTFGLRIGF